MEKALVGCSLKKVDSTVFTLNRRRVIVALYGTKLGSKSERFCRDFCSKRLAVCLTLGLSE